jgi:5-methylcytosine-specific restriction endonuclease McrA
VDRTTQGSIPADHPKRRSNKEIKMQTLMLDQSYAPIKVISWQRAIRLLTLGKVQVIEEYDNEVRTSYLVIKVPAVVRLIRGFRRVKKPVKFSRVNIYGRDKYTCQYCGAKKAMDDLSYDHVLPKSRGGRTTWENIVTACSPCNLRKANRTPAEAGMRLTREPTQPVDQPVVMIAISRKSAPAAWRDYLYWTGELDSD